MVEWVAVLRAAAMLAELAMLLWLVMCMFVDEVICLAIKNLMRHGGVAWVRVWYLPYVKFPRTPCCVWLLRACR
jgi:hypothetical protein